MKWIKITWLAIVIGLTACNNTNTNRGSNADKYKSVDTTGFSKEPVDTFNTRNESATNGPDNAPPNQSDSNTYNVNEPTHYNNSRGGK